MIWNPLKQSRRRTWTSSGPKFGRLGVTGMFSVALLLLIFVAGWLIDRRGATEAEQQLAEIAEAAELTPEQYLVRAARSARIVFLSDIHNSAGIKRVAARAIRQIAESPGLDAVVLEVGSDMQPYIDQYFARTPEDASVLLSHPRTVREPGAAVRAYLEIYHAIWEINEKLGPDERIRVIAADLPGWPLERALSPAEVARLMATRAEHMANVVENDILSRIPSARIFVFMSGFHAMKSGTLAVQTGGAEPQMVEPLASVLAAATDEVYSILADAPSSGTRGRDIAPYLGTRIAPILQQQGVGKAFGMTVTGAFDDLRHPIIERKSPGVEFGVRPRDYKLRDVADGYIHAGN